MLLRFPKAYDRARAQGSPRGDELLPLVRATCTGDDAAGSTLVSLITPHVFRQVRRILGSGHGELEDVTQEAIVQVMNALPRYRQESSVVHFACRIAVKVAIDVRRRHNSRQRRGGDLQRYLEVQQEARQLVSQQFQNEYASVEALRQLLGSLPEEQAEALALHYVVGLTVNEIATLTETPFETVRSRLRTGMSALRHTLNASESESERTGRASNER